MVALHPIALTALPTDGALETGMDAIHERASEAVGHSLVCGDAFTITACGISMSNRNSINIRSCNAQASWGCQTFGVCDGESVMFSCEGLGDCGCEPT